MVSPACVRDRRRLRCPGLAGWLVRAAAFLAGMVLARADAEPVRGLSVEDLLRLESIGVVAFHPGDGGLLFERLRPYRDAPDFGRPFLNGKDRARLHLLEPGGRGVIRPLFQQHPAYGYWMGPFSPDGTRLSLFWIGEGKVGTGVLELSSGRLTVLPVTPDIGFRTPLPLWISDTELILLALPEGEQPLAADANRAGAEAMMEAWQEAWRGQVATSSLLASGRLRERHPLPVSVPALIRANAEAGTTRRMDSGHFTDLALAPGRRYLAAFRRPSDLGGHAADPIGSFDSEQPKPASELVLYDLNTPTARAHVCQECRPLLGSFDWSPDGGELLFVDAGRTGVGPARLMRLAPGTGKLQPVLLGALSLATAEQSQVIGIHIGDGLAVQAEPADRPAGKAGGSETPAADRTDWYFLRPKEEPVNLTARLDSANRRLVARSGAALFFIVEGDLWRVAIDGQRDNLTAGIAAPIGLWKPSERDQASPDTLDRDHLMLISARNSGQRDVLIASLATGRTERVARLGEDSELLAVSPEKRELVLRRVSPDGTDILHLEFGGAPVPITRLNQHLAGVAPGSPVRIEAEDKDGRSLPAWLLLPPDHAPGDGPLPTVVIIYPGSVREGPWRWRVSRFSPFNPNLLAGHGYAVLMPSLPLGPMGTPGDPLSGLADALSPAIEQAATLGYIDLERLGLFGQSYGGYGVLGIVSQTDRFKAAVTSAGLSDLISLYGQFDVRFRVRRNPAAMLHGLQWSERGQGRMGMPPWKAVERYRRNSPLFHVEQINTPILLLHGDLDYVPIGQAEEIFTALHRLGKEVAFVRYWGESHVPASPANIRDYWNRIFAWFDHYLALEHASAPPVQPSSRGAEPAGTPE